MLQTSLEKPRALAQLDFADGAWPSAEELHVLMRDYGVVHLRGFYRADADFLAYVDELIWCAGALMREHGIARAGDDLESMINTLHAHDPELARRVYLVGTQPIQLVAGNSWKYSSRTMAIARAVLGDTARLATPTAGDTFLGHHYGEAGNKYLLPIHQDYPYLLQSEQMLTFWTPMSRRCAGVGGLTLWPTSHLAGPLRAHLDAYDHLEAEVPANAAYPEIRILDWEFGDLVLMHGSLLHRGDHNSSPTRTRMVQLFRYTDLDQPVAIKTAWALRAYPRPNTTYDEVLPLFYRG